MKIIFCLLGLTLSSIAARAAQPPTCFWTPDVLQVRAESYKTLIVYAKFGKYRVTGNMCFNLRTASKITFDSFESYRVCPMDHIVTDRERCEIDSIEATDNI